LSKLADWFIDRPLNVLLIIVVAWVVSRIARRYTQRLVRRMVAPDRGATARRLRKVGIDDPAKLIGEDPQPRRENRAASISAVVSSTMAILIWVVASYLIIAVLGVDLAPLVAGAGLAGLAVGFGAQNLVKDTIAGFFMLIEDQYGIGDIVDLGEAVGEVEEFSLRTTVLRSLDGIVWHVPNGEVRRVGNQSQLWSVALIDIDVSYDSDLDAAQQVILDAAVELCESEEWCGDVIEEPIVLGVESLGADGITLRMVVKTIPAAQWALQRALRKQLKTALDAAGIEIPFPQRTLWLRHDDAVLTTPTETPDA
jgi:small-conductance mechanosensitive channel